MEQGQWHRGNGRLGCQAGTPQQASLILSRGFTFLDLQNASMVDSTSTLSSRNFFWSCESKTVSATRVRMSPVKRPCDSVRSPNSSMPPLAPLVDEFFATIKLWTQTKNYAIKNSEQDNQAAQRMQELEEEAAKYKQRLRSAGLQVTPTKALPIQDPASVASSRPVSKTRSKHHLFLHQTPQVINQPRRRLQRGDRKKQYGHKLEEPFNVIKQSGQDPPTSMTSLKTWVTNIKKNLPSPKPHAAGPTDPRKGKLRKAQLQEMATRWGLPISLITSSAATPKTLQQLISAVTFFAA